MKKIKFMAILTIATVLMSMMTGCDSFTTSSGSGGGTASDGSGSGGSNNTLTGTVTLKQFLDSGPKVGFVGTPDKSKYPEIYFFENGKIYMVCTWETYKGYYANDKKGEGKGAITWGDIAKMTDEELLELAREHKQLKYLYYGGRFNIVEGSLELSSRGYTLHIYTDSTGNNFAYENIEVSFVFDSGNMMGILSGKLISSSEKAVIYDSSFSGLENEDGNVVLYFRTGENLTIVPDNLGDSGIEVD